MKINLDTAAHLLGTSKEMLLRWARQGVILASESKSGYQFDRKEIERWAKRRRMPIRTEQMNQGLKERCQTISLVNAMRRGGVYFDIAGSDVEAVLLSSLAAAEVPQQGSDYTELLNLLMEREELASTGIGNGVAIPHPRYPFENSPDGGMICTCFLKEKVDFQAIDGELVSVVFLMFSPDTKTHLQLLSRLSLCLHNADFLSFLANCRLADSLLSKVLYVEQQFNKHTKRKIIP